MVWYDIKPQMKFSFLSLLSSKMQVHHNFPSSNATGCLLFTCPKNLRCSPPPPTPMPTTPPFLVEIFYDDFWIEVYQYSKLVHWLLQMGLLLSDHWPLKWRNDIRVIIAVQFSKPNVDGCFVTIDNSNRELQCVCACAYPVRVDVLVQIFFTGRREWIEPSFLNK